MSSSPINLDTATRDTLINKIKMLEQQLFDEREEYKQYYSKTKYIDTNRTQELIKNNQILITENTLLKNKCQELEIQLYNETTQMPELKI